MVLHCLRDGDAEPRVIQEGDTVVVYERFDAMKAVTVTTKGQYSNRFGNFAMKVRMGGCKWVVRCSFGNACCCTHHPALI